MSGSGPHDLVCFYQRVLLGSAQLLVRRWNARLSRDILASWLDLLNSQGWIAREQATFLLFVSA